MEKAHYKGHCQNGSYKYLFRAAMANLSQARPNILPQFFWLVVSIETQNLGKAQALGALPAVAALLHTYFNQRDPQSRPRGVANEKEMKKQKETETEKKDEHRAYYNTSSSTSTNELCWCLRCFDFPEDFKEIDETTTRLTADPVNNKASVLEGEVQILHRIKKF